MCIIDYDKLIVGSSDEYIKLYQLQKMGTFLDDDDRPNLVSSDPLATYKFEESGINNLCSLNE